MKPVPISGPWHSGVSAAHASGEGMCVLGGMKGAWGNVPLELSVHVCSLPQAAHATVPGAVCFPGDRPEPRYGTSPLKAGAFSTALISLFEFLVSRNAF